jgi:pimeloyl-ACP methyl ester carboxylesterase
LIADLRRQGVGAWARHGMGSRLGERFPAAGVAWWAELMGRTDLESQVGFMTHIECADISADLPRIACPTLVITSEGSGVAAVEETRAWQQRIPGSELMIVPGSSYHVAASDPDLCAQATAAFIARRANSPPA